MELAEANTANSGSGDVQKSSTAIAESSQEMSFEKTATGSIEKAISSQSQLEQSVVQQKSMTTQKTSSISSSSSADDNKDNDTSTITTTVTKTIKQQQPKQNDDDNNNNNNNDVETKTITKKVTIKKDTKPLIIKKEVKINDDIVKIEDVQNDNDDNETEIIEIIDGDEENNNDGENNVEIVETVVIKKSTIPPPSSNGKNDDDNDNNTTTTTTTKTITTKNKIINKENSKDDLSNIDDDNNNQNTDVTIKLNQPKKEIKSDTKSNNDDDDKIKETSQIKQPQQEQQQQQANKIESVAVTKEEKSPPPSKKEEIKETTPINEKVIKETVSNEVNDKVIKEEEEEEEEFEEVEEEEEEEEEEPEEIVKEKESLIEDKNIVAQKPPLPTSVLHQQLSQEEQQQQQKDEYRPQLQQEKQQYQMQQQQQQPQVGQHDKQQYYHRSPPSSTEIKQENIKNQLKEIISDIDRVIEQEEDKTTSLPQQQHQQRWQPMQHQPQQQQQQQQQPQQQHQVSSTTTREESRDDGYSRKMERIERNEFQDHDDGSTQIRSTRTSTTVKSTPQQLQHQLPPSGQNIYHYGTPSSIIKPYDQLKGHRSMSLPSPYAVEQSSTSSTTKTVDLQKIFTPATDYEEILPKNRILYSSSAFYSPNLHPTVEDQVELARRISHSLSDISNQQSKGQSMYVNRKKRSVKWVHEGEGKAQIQQDYNSSSSGYHHGYDGYKENEYEQQRYHDKLPLKLVMNPRGQVRDFTSVRHDFNQETSGLLSPDKCAELVAGLNAPKGKGAELFAKRRKKSEKWIVDETNAAQQSPSGVQPYGTVSPNILPAYSDVGVQRVQLNMHQDQVQDKYSQPRIKMIKTPWEAALETGSASSAFQELPNLKQPASFVSQQSTGYDYSNYTPITYQQQLQQLQPQQQQQQQQYHHQEYEQQYSQTQQQQQQQKSWQPNSQRDLAYKPSIPQGWNAPPTTLPKELYVPKEIPLDGYIPPATEKYLPSNQSAYSSVPAAVPPTSSLYNPQQSYQSNDYSSTYQQHQLSSSISGAGGGGAVTDTDIGTSGYGGYGSGIGLSTSPIPKQFPISQQYSSTLSSSYLSGGGSSGGGGNDGVGVSTLAPRSISPYYQQQQQIPSVSGGVAATASTFNNYNVKNTFPLSQQQIKSSNYYSAPPINKPINNWRTQPNLANHPSPVAFNPSPLPYEKLAKFQQPDPYENDGGNFHVPLPGIRRPLAVPNSGYNKIRNLSPLPYMKSSLSPSFNTQQQQQQQQQSTTTTKTTTHYQTTQQSDNQEQYNSNQYYNDSSKYTSGLGGGSGGGSCGTNVIYGSDRSTNKTLKSVDLSHCPNYNTSARGWGQTKNCYKPMTFTKSPIAADMPYTDF